MIVYSAQLCSDCQILKAWLDEKGVSYENLDIKENLNAALELERTTGKLGVPYLRFGDKWVRGYSLEAPFSEEFITKILDEEGIAY